MRVDSALQIVLDSDRACGDGGRRIALRFCASARHVAENGRLAAELSVFDRQERSWTPAQDAALSGFVKLAASLHGHEPARQSRFGEPGSGDFHRALFNDNPRSLIIYDALTLQVLEVNRAAQTLYGYDAAEFRSLAVSELWPPATGVEAGLQPEDAGAFIRSLALQQPTELFRRTHLRKDRRAIDVELSSTPLAYGGTPARLLHILDLTKKMEVQRLAAQASRAQRMLGACNEALIRAASEEELLRRICQVAVEIGGYMLAWIGFAHDDAAKTVVPAAVAGANGHLVLENKLSWHADTDCGQNSAGRAIRAGKADVTFDVREDSSFPIWKSCVETIGYRGIVTLPLRRRGNVSGAMCFYSADVAQVGASELSLLEALADDVAFGIENLRLQDEQRRLHDAVLSVGSAVSHRMGDDFFKHLVEGLVEAVGAQAGQLAGILPGAAQTCQSRFAVADGQELRLGDFRLNACQAEQVRRNEVWLSNSEALKLYPHPDLCERVDATACAVHRLDDGRGEPIGFLAVLFRAPQSQTRFVEAMLRIFAARAASELQRLKSDAHIRSQASLVDKAQDAIYVRDLNHRILTWNQGCQRIFGWTPSEVVGRNGMELASGDKVEMTARHELLLHHGTWEGEAVHRRKDGSLVHVETRWTLVRDEQGRPESVLSISTDITRRKATEEAVHRLAFFDPLTGLPNRQSFNATLRATRIAAPKGADAGALLFVNVDKFKFVNETLGHGKGDLLLKLVSSRLQSAIVPSGNIAHIGADEFVILLAPVHPSLAAAQAHAGDVSQRILGEFKEPFRLQEFVHMTTVCIGIASFIGESISDEELLQHADLAMFQAKSVGRGSVRFYDPRLHIAASERAALERDLRLAVASNELQLYYQPQLHRDGRLIGVEALLRWKHETRGMVSPAQFIPIAEETGLILAIGHWVLDQACQRLSVWQKADARDPRSSMALSINVSASQFRQDDFVDQVVASLGRYSVRPAGLKIELTESLLVYDMESIIQKMRRLRSIGIGLSLDDFGTGYSSLSYLTRMPLEQLKIDQAFVRDVMADRNSAAIARSIISLGHDLGLTVVAEGVEDENQRAFLVDNFCDGFQGYLFARPMPLEELEQFADHHLVTKGATTASQAAVLAPAEPDHNDVLAAVAQAVPAMIAVNGPDERYLFVNKRFEKWFGVRSSEIVGRTSLQVLGRAEYQRSAPWIRQALAGETVSFEKAFPNRTPPVHVAVSFIPLHTSDGASNGYVTVAQDVTHHREETHRLLQLSERDPLTGLLNRRGFESYLSAEASGGRGNQVGLLYVDLDHFKRVNDAHGHPLGDEVLRQFAARLRGAVRPDDGIARVGGDEFAVILKDVPSEALCHATAEKILSVTHQPFHIAGIQLSITVSIGVAFGVTAGEDYEQLVRRADVMLYQAKAGGRGRWV